MTQVLNHPEALVEIQQLSDGRRRVTVKPNDAVMFIPWRSTETDYPLELLQAILDAKGPAYLCDEILRDESPTYVRTSLERDLFAYRSPEWFVGKRLLDFGCGAGASTLCLAKLFPESDIVGVELDPTLLEVARRRMKYYGYNHVQVRRSPSALELPEGLELFDAVILSAVYEHLLPEERAHLLPKLWRVVKPDGVLFLNQTPHRYFPVESHTTGLPLINYLPDRLALVAARLFSKRVGRRESWTNLLRYGIRGATEGEILSILASQAARPRLCEPHGRDIVDRIDLWHHALNPHRYRLVKRVIRAGLKLLKRASGVTLVPTLSLMFQKSEDGPSVSTCQRRVKVCFISPLGDGLYHPGSGYPFGGAEVQSYVSANELGRDPAYTVTVLVTVREPSCIEHQPRLTIIRRQAKARLTDKPPTLCRAYGTLLSFIEMLNQLRCINADVFLHAGGGIEVGAYALICRLLRRRFVFIVASTMDLSTPDGGVRGPLKRLYPLGLRLAHAIVCRTEEQRAALHERYGREGILIRTAHPVPAESDQQRTSVLWVGRIHPLKQPQLFLDLAEQLSEYSCVLIGMRDEAHMDLWQIIQRRAAGLSNVSFHANLPLHCVDELFRSAKVFVNTSTHEGFPNTFVQAALNGVPIVSWRVNPDLVLSRHQIGFCAGESFRELASSVRRLCSDRRLHDDYRRRARAYGIDNHSLDRSLSQLKQLLVSLASTTHGTVKSNT
jgi:glycosyltransferase involved in cell wall biosynthesis